MSSAAAPQLPADAYEDRSATVIGVVAFCLFFATSMVGARIYTRACLIHQLGIDDYFCVFSLFVVYGCGIAIAHMTYYGLGKHIYVMDPEEIPLYLRDFYVSIVFYTSSLMVIKLTFLFQYYRVLAVQNMRKIYIAAIIIVGAWGLSQALIGIFICTPISGFWDSTIKATCIPDLPQWYINAAGNIITDVAVFVLPLPAIWKLNLARPQKLLLLGIFSLGFFTVVISMIRIRFLKLFEDFPWENVEPSCWSMGELTSAITCACLPTLRPFVSRYFPGLGSLIGRSTKGYAKTSDPRSRGDVEAGNSRRAGGAGGLKAMTSNAKSAASTADSEVELHSPVAAAKGSTGNPFGSSRKTSEDGASVGTGGSDGMDAAAASPRSRSHIFGLSSTVRTHVAPAPPHPDTDIEKAAIHGVQVQRDVYQTRSHK